MLSPFSAVRPKADFVQQIASVPYDVVSTTEAKEIVKDNPLSFLHVTRPEVDFPDDKSIPSEKVYEKAKENLNKLLEDGYLVTEEKPSFYLYRLKWGGHIQTAVVGCSSVDDYDNDLIKKHEKTRVDKEKDRTQLMLKLKAQTGPVFLTYRGIPEISSFVQDHMENNDPIYNFQAEDTVCHTVWRIKEIEFLVKAFNKVPASYVADGHHRARSASLAYEKLKNISSESGNFLTALFPAEELMVLPYNRFVHDLNGMVSHEFLASLKKVCTNITENASPEPATKGKISLYIDAKWYLLELPDSENDDPVSLLDAAILQKKILKPLLAIHDPRMSEKISFIGGIRGTNELERLVNNKEGSVAFSLYPVQVKEVLDVADAGMLLPPKCTWFEPKLRSGLFVHSI
tara:strand:- start:19859 stop:21061 length:1203 start_codon:yes stop_codon:yes gene_type:complete